MSKSEHLQFLYREVIQECGRKIAQYLKREKKANDDSIETPLEFLYWVRKSLLRCKETHDRVVAKIHLSQELGFPVPDEDNEDKKLIVDDVYTCDEYLDTIIEITMRTFALYRALLQKVTAEHALNRIRYHFGSLREWKRLLQVCLTNKQAAEYAACGLIPVGLAVGITALGVFFGSLSFISFGLPVLIGGVATGTGLIYRKYNNRRQEEERIRQNIVTLEEKQRIFLNQWEKVGEMLSEQNLRYIIETLKEMTDSNRQQFERIFDLRLIPVTAIGDECPICYCPLTEGDVCGLDTCSHIFHATCINTWSHQVQQSRHDSCPICRLKFGRIVTIVADVSVN